MKTGTSTSASFFSPAWWKKNLLFHRFPLILLFGTFGIYFILLFSRILYYKPDGLYAGHVHVWGDWALHISIAQLFAQKNPSDWFAYHPYFAGGKLTYPFLTHMISGLLMRTGLSLPLAFTLPSIVFALGMLLAMYLTFYLLLKSRKVALTATSLFFLSSGPGFIRFIPDWLKNPTFAHFIFPLKDYSRLENYQWLAGNVVNGMLMPQRAFLIGMLIALWSLVLFIFVLQRTTILDKKWQRILLVSAGILAGILPIAHVHSFIVLVITTGLCSLASWKKWPVLAFYVIPAGLISSFLYLKFLAGGIENPEFMQLMIGWTAGPHLFKWLEMWWQIWGVVLLVGMLGIPLAWKRGLVTGAYLSSFWLIFALGNIILFQPIQWDNSKLFLWTYFGLSALSALVLQWLWHRKKLFMPVGKIVAIVLCVFLTGTGFFELARLQRIDKNSHRMLSWEDMTVGEWARTHTDPRAIFLTNPAHDHPIMVWGARSILLGYPGWAFNFGFLYTQREQDIKEMYTGSIQTPQLLKKYQVSYVAVGPGELSNLGANEAYFQTNYPQVFASQQYRIYDVR